MSEVPPGYYQSATPVVGDWGEVVSFTPRTYFTPTSLDELKAVLAQVIAGPPGASLRFLGGLHSCSGIFQSEVVVDTSQLPLEFTVGPAPNGAVVVASANMHLHDFLARAADHNLSLTSTGGTDAQTLAGLISTNTAGATSHHTVYECVDWVEYLTVAPDGRSIVQAHVARADPAFPAVICSLGAIGYLTRVGFTLVDQRFYEGTFEIRKLADVLTDPAATSAQYDFWRIEWLPKMDRGLFWSANPVAGAPAGDYPADGAENILKWAEKLDNEVFESSAFCNLPLEAVYEILADTYTTATSTGPMRNIIPCDRVSVLRVAMAEWSFAPADLQRAMGACRTYFDANKWPNLPIEIECAKTDDHMMSPWNWPGLDYIMKFNFQYLTEILSAPQKAEMVAHLQGLWNALTGAGIPFKSHWGKLNFMSPDRVARDYELAGFKPFIKPVFLNDYLRKALGMP